MKYYKIISGCGQAIYKTYDPEKDDFCPDCDLVFVKDCSIYKEDDETMAAWVTHIDSKRVRPNLYIRELTEKEAFIEIL